MNAVTSTMASVAGSLWAIAAVVVRHNHRHAPSIDHEAMAAPGEGNPQSVCVVVPARDEERNIGACLEGLCRSDYPRLRIRVVDDGSADGTPLIVAALARTDPRVELLRIDELPPGWLGKNHALWRGTRACHEDWLLFIDADMRVAPSCIARAVTAAQRRGADLLTIVPKLEMLTFWELAVQAVIVHAILLSLDSRNINDPASHRAAAIGPFMLFRRTAYEAVGGHEAVRAEVVEDLRLAEAVKRTGLRLVFARGTEVAILRMYDSLSAIVDGWSKNFHVSLGERSWHLPFAVVGLLFFYGAPWLVPLAGLVCGDFAGAAVGAAALAMAIAARLDFQRLYGVTAERAYLAPLGALVASWILV
ncbi:MAG: glycosyltransferase, partial [Myxococcota bacterium]|nr:glycosyltransferase [Myxococcota bacterium]